MTRSTVSAPPAWRLDLDEPVIALAALPDAVVAGGSEGTLVVADAGGRERLRLRLDDFLLGLAASPDGTRLAAAGGERIAVWDLADGTMLRDQAVGWCSALAWTARSDRLAAGDGKQVRIVDRDGHRCWTSAPLPSTVSGLAWLRRDGRRVAAGAYQGVTVLEPASDRLVEHLAAPGAIAGLAVAPSGRWVVGGSQDATLHGWKVPGGDDFRMSGFPATVSRLEFDTDGRWLACNGGDVVVCWDFSGAGPAGREALLAEGHRGAVTALTWMPREGAHRALASGDDAGEIALWRLGAGAAPGDRIHPSRRFVTGDPVDAVAVAGPVVVSGHRSGALRGWNR